MKKIIAVCSVIILMLGGCQKVDRSEILRQEQERIALHMYNLYEGIEKISFWDISKSTHTGSWDFSGMVNDKLDFLATLSSIGNEAGIYIMYDPAEYRLIKKVVRTAISDSNVISIEFFEGN